MPCSRGERKIRTDAARIWGRIDPPGLLFVVPDLRIMYDIQWPAYAAADESHESHSRILVEARFSPWRKDEGFETTAARHGFESR
ncbi:hypothetical protein VTN96DRAFT_5798 [Rasamsonia emersonii]